MQHLFDCYSGYCALGIVTADIYIPPAAFTWDHSRALQAQQQQPPTPHPHPPSIHVLHRSEQCLRGHDMTQGWGHKPENSIFVQTRICSLPCLYNIHFFWHGTRVVRLWVHAVQTLCTYKYGREAGFNSEPLCTPSAP